MITRPSSAQTQVLAIAGDPGGAAALLPVLQALAAASCTLRACPYAHAISIWESAGIPCEPLSTPPWPAQISDARLLLVGTSVNTQQWELIALDLARQTGIPSLAVLDFWSNYWRRFTDSQGHKHLPDRIAIMDDLARDDMLKAGFSANQLVVTGQPAFDRLSATRKAFSLGQRAALRQALGLTPASRLVLFVSQPFSEIHGHPEATRMILGFDEQQVLSQTRAALAHLCAQEGIPIHLAIRPHPRESREKFPSAKDGGFSAAIWDGTDQLQAVLTADLVVGMNSALLYEAALMGCPVLSFQPGLKGADALPSNRSGLSTAVYEANQLETALKKALSEGNRAFMNAVFLENSILSGDATMAVVAEAHRLLARSSNP